MLGFQAAVIPTKLIKSHFKNVIAFISPKRYLRGTARDMNLVVTIAKNIAIIGFIYVMEIPRKYIIQCCATGCVAWVCFILFDYAKIDMVWATFLATLLAELVSYIFARIYKAPVITFLIAGIIPLVPGIYIYRAAYYFVTKSPLSSSALTDTIKLAAVIALGILIMGTILQVITRGIKKISKKQ